MLKLAFYFTCISSLFIFIYPVLMCFVLRNISAEWNAQWEWRHPCVPESALLPGPPLSKATPVRSNSGEVYFTCMGWWSSLLIVALLRNIRSRVRWVFPDAAAVETVLTVAHCTKRICIWKATGRNTTICISVPLQQ